MAIQKLNSWPLIVWVRRPSYHGEGISYTKKQKLVVLLNGGRLGGGHGGIDLISLMSHLDVVHPIFNLC